MNAAGSTTYWSNDGSSAGGSQPATAVPITVTNGLYSVLLGDTTLANMTTIPPSVFNNSDVRLRVWFDDGTNGPQALVPDQRIAAVGYAVIAGNVPDGAITGAKIAAGTITGSNIASGTITGANIAGGAVGNNQLAAGAAAANLAAGSQSAVGSGGIIFSAAIDPALVAAGYVNIGSMTTIDGWQQRITTAPPANGRFQVTGVWTGTEMIVWGGWRWPGRSISTTDRGTIPSPIPGRRCPLLARRSVRHGHTAIWTGSEMIVWGGTATRQRRGWRRWSLQSDHQRLVVRWQCGIAAKRALLSHGGVDRKRDDRLGWRRHAGEFERWRALQSERERQRGIVDVAGERDGHATFDSLHPHRGLDRHRYDHLGRRRRRATR